MFEVGFSELLLIMALALIVLGPEKLPKVASQVGRWMGRARAMARQFRETLEEEVQLEETRKPRSAASGTASGAGAAASGAAVAGGLAASASEPGEPVFDTSNIPFADVQNPVYDAGVTTNGVGTNGATEPGASATAGASYDADADTRHNDYAGAAYEPPVELSDAAAAPHAEPDVQRGN